ncbi:MAG: 30S ribosomal protein S16, partial [Bacteroidales bacterium]|nr:30S ribosomal protein S16 [Bacteroidales bacterium]
EGVKKGAFDDAEATRRFETWMKQNEEKIESKKSNLEKSKDDDVSSRLLAEKKINDARAARLAKKLSDLAAKEAAEAAPAEEAPAETAAEATAETTDEAAVETVPETVVETADEAPAVDETSIETPEKETSAE